ncbi:MAG: TonB-dependent receptor [bacterium]
MTFPKVRPGQLGRGAFFSGTLPLLLLLLETAPAVAQAPVAQTPVTRLDTVSIVATRTRVTDATRAVDVISRDEISRSSARNIAELLSERLSVDVYGRSAAQADISLRGSTAEQTLVLVDGVRVSDAQSSHYALDLAVPLSSVDRVEILRGSGSALYGPDAIGGVINIITRRDTQGAELRTRGGSFGTVGGGATGSMALGGFAIRSSEEYEKSDGFRAGTDHRISQARVALTGGLLGGQLSSNVGVGTRDFGANDFYGAYNSTERTQSETADSRWESAIDRWMVTVGASTRRHTDRFTLVRDNPQIYQNYHETWQSTGEVTARTTALGMALVAGGDVENAQLSSARLGGRHEWRGAGFLESTAGSATSPSADLGVRVDQSSIYGGFFSPTLGVALPLSDAVKLRASVARGLRAPTWTERYYSDPANQGNPDLVPERFNTGDAGVRFATTSGLAFDAGAFVRKADNLIDWVKPVGAPTGSLWRATNVGNATYHGVEGTITLPSWNAVDAAIFASGITFDDAQGAGLSGKYALRPVTRQIGARGHWTIAPALQLSAEMVHARRATEDGYTTGNARLQWSTGRIGITVDANNIANAEWLDASAQPVAGRAVYLGVLWR